METDYENSYKFTAAKRGRAVIIVNETFQLISNDRTGADEELIKMKEFFQILGFEPKIFLDKTAGEMGNILKEVAQDEEQRGEEDSDCFALVICSHGAQEYPQSEPGSVIAYTPHLLYGVDGDHVLTEHIIEYFNDSNCRALRGKPKLFFFQACRCKINSALEQKLDIGIPINIIDEDTKTHDTGPKSGQETDSGLDQHAADKISIPNKNLEVGDIKSLAGSGHKDTTLSFAEEEKDKHQHIGASASARSATDLNISIPTGDDIAEVAEIPCHTDMIMMFASPEGKFAFRRAEDGGWLVQALYEGTKNDGFEKMDFLTFLTTVTHYTVQHKQFQPGSGSKYLPYRGSKIIPYITHRLRKNIYFNDSKFMPRRD